LGGLPIKRDAAEGVVEQVAAVIRAEREIILAVTPEGTRKRVPQWKTGFHRIAAAADVPIVPVQLDWGRREVRIREPVLPETTSQGISRRCRRSTARTWPDTQTGLGETT